MPPPPPFRWWILRGLGDEPALVQESSAPLDSGLDILDSIFVLGYLDGWLMQPESREILHDICATLLGPLAVAAWGHGEEHLSLRATLRTAFERQDLVVLVERRRDVSPPGRPLPPPLPPRPLPRPPQPDTAWFQLQVVDDVGAPIAGLGLTMTVDGSPRSLTTDARGVARVDGARTSFATASIQSMMALRALVKPRWNQPRKPSQPTGPDVVTQQLDDQIEPVSLESETPGILVIVPRFECREIAGACFDFGRSFVLLAASAELSRLSDDLAADVTFEAMVFGHSDLGTGDVLDKELSERRARAIVALLTRDADAWESLATGADDSATGWREQWGTREIQHILNVLGNQPSLREDGVLDEATGEAVRVFQRQALSMSPASGDVDAATRRALFDRYAPIVCPRPVDAARLGRPGDGAFMGCGLYNPVSLHGKDDESRRGVLFLYDLAARPQNLPCKLRDIGPCLSVTIPPITALGPDTPVPYRCSVYKAVALSCPCQGGAARRHDLVLRFPLDEAEAKTLPHELVLESGDGTIVRRRRLAEATASAASSVSELLFEKLPGMLDYRLRCEGVESPYTIFDTTAYTLLSQLGPAEEDDDDQDVVALLDPEESGTDVA